MASGWSPEGWKFDFKVNFMDIILARFRVLFLVCMSDGLRLHHYLAILRVEMALRDGIEYHWLGSRHYVGRMHAGGVVMTGPMRHIDALRRAEEIIKDGVRAAIAEETLTRAAWFNITNQLF